MTPDEISDLLAAGLRAHGQQAYDREVGTFKCRCGWRGGYLSRHQVDVLLPTVREAIADERERVLAPIRALADELGPNPVALQVARWIRQAIADVEQT